VSVARLFALTLLALAAPGRLWAGAVRTNLPEPIDPGAHYLFYFHGRIIELQGPEAISPDFGRYEYRQILEALAGRGFTVISALRKGGDEDAAVARVVEQVRALLAARVPVENITVTGFSKGGHLAIAVAGTLQEARVSFVTMAGCSSGDWAETWAPKVRGRVLSLFDEADRFQPSCTPLFAKATLSEKREIVLHKGLDHGLFYAPRSEWLDPLTLWALHEPLPASLEK
jgi:dienelactone hydrolase